MSVHCRRSCVIHSSRRNWSNLRDNLSMKRFMITVKSDQRIGDDKQDIFHNLFSFLDFGLTHTHTHTRKNSLDFWIMNYPKTVLVSIRQENSQFFFKFLYLSCSCSKFSGGLLVQAGLTNISQCKLVPACLHSKAFV